MNFVNNISNELSAKVAILLCTYNGQRYLAEQLASIESQSYPHWEVHASDDGSKDGTLDLLQQQQNKFSKDKFFIHKGPAKGFTKNFFSLINNSSIMADYYAYCDQDDIWQADKLERAVNYLKTVPSKTPALYCTRKEFINEAGEHLGYSPICKKPPLFANALVQNICSGHTIVINDAARSLLQETCENIDISIHDWWTYLVISGCGGKVFYDTYPSVRYRQHGDNVFGGSTGLMAKWNRIRMLFHGSLKEWNDINIAALIAIKAKLMPENRVVLDRFNKAREQWLLARACGIKESGVYRQTFIENLALSLAVLLNKI